MNLQPVNSTYFTHVERGAQTPPSELLAGSGRASHHQSRRSTNKPLRQGNDAHNNLVLVVDDDPDMLDLLTIVLHREGLQVETASDGPEALSRIRTQRPTLIMLDLNLPTLPGEIVAKEVRTHHGNSVHIILISANQEVEAIARRVGAAGALRKPFAIPTLLNLTRQALAANGIQ